jgi:hypothetical protein
MFVFPNSEIDPRVLRLLEFICEVDEYAPYISESEWHDLIHQVILQSGFTDEADALRATLVAIGEGLSSEQAPVQRSIN